MCLLIFVEQTPGYTWNRNRSGFYNQNWSLLYRVDRNVVLFPVFCQRGDGQHVGQLGLVEGGGGIVVSRAVQVIEVNVSLPVVQVHQVEDSALTEKY